MKLASEGSGESIENRELRFISGMSQGWVTGLKDCFVLVFCVEDREAHLRS